MGRRLLLALLIGLLTGCGWHLRGSGPSAASLEGRRLYVDSEVAGELPATVARGLRLAGAETVPAPEAADAVLALLGEQVQRRAAAVSENARVQEYEIAYRLRFRLVSPGGGLILPEQEVGSSQVYRYDRTNVLGSQSQEAVVTERLRQDAIRLLLPRVQAALQAAATPPDQAE